MNCHAYVGLDLGSSRIKAVALDYEGCCIASSSRPNFMHTGPGGIAEQYPENWFDITGEVLRELVTKLTQQSIKPVAIANTGQMNGPVFLDSKGKPNGPVQMWCDNRCISQCRLLEKRIDPETLLKTTGHTIATGYTAPKLLWIDEHNPDQIKDATHMVFPKDFISNVLTGQVVTDYSDASNSLLLNIRSGEWDKEILQAMDLQLPELPQLAESSSVIGFVNKEGSEWSGLAQGIPVAAGAGDSIAAALGAGLRDPSMVQIVVGSAGNVNCVFNEVMIDDQGRVHTGYFVDQNHWICSAVQQSAGASLQWWSSLIGVDPKILVEEVDICVPPTNFFAPYLCGERTPHLDPEVRGAFFNLNQNTSRGDLTRAILEGVAFSFRDAFEIFQIMGVFPNQAAISGGGGENLVWQRIIAAVLGVPLIVGPGDTTAMGAAMLAACAAGRFQSWVEAIDTWSPSKLEIEADPELVKWYQNSYQQFKNLYPNLKMLTC